MDTSNSRSFSKKQKKYYQRNGSFNYGYSPDTNELSISNQCSYPNLPNPVGLKPQAEPHQIQPLPYIQSQVGLLQESDVNSNVSNTLEMTPSNFDQCSIEQNTDPIIIIRRPTQDVTDLSVNDHIIRVERIVNIVAYSILLISAPIVLIMYAIFMTTIVPPLNLFETGNWWTFLVLLISCILTIIASAFGLEMTYRAKLGYLSATFILIVLALCAMTPVLTVAIGAAEVSKSKNGPIEITRFGHYISTVCGPQAPVVDNKVELFTRTTPHPVPGLQGLDGDKCDAATALKIGIYCMYIWAFELLIVLCVAGKFGAANWNRNRLRS